MRGQDINPFRRISPEEVDNPDLFEKYAQQRLGIGYVTHSDRAMFKRQIKLFFQNYPGSDWSSLIKIVDWAQAKNKRFSRIHFLVTSARWALEDGFLPELDPNNSQNIDLELNLALQKETDADWRRRMLSAKGEAGKRMILDMWKEKNVG